MAGGGEQLPDCGKIVLWDGIPWNWDWEAAPWGWSTLLLTGGGLLLGCLKRWLLGWFGGGLDGWIRNL